MGSRSANPGTYIRVRDLHDTVCERISGGGGLGLEGQEAVLQPPSLPPPTTESLLQAGRVGAPCLSSAQRFFPLLMFSNRQYAQYFACLDIYPGEIKTYVCIKTCT